MVDNITDREKEILQKFSLNRSMIRDGKLTEDNEKMLLELRAVEDYIKLKYPNRKLEIVDCDPNAGEAWDYNSWLVVDTGEEQGSEPSYVQATLQEDGKYTIVDNFYSKDFNQKATEALADILKQGGIPFVDAQARFGAYLGQDKGLNMNTNDLLKGAVHSEGTYLIFLDVDGLGHGSYEDNYKEIREYLSSKGLKGWCSIVILEDKDADRTKGRLFSKGFSL